MHVISIARANNVAIMLTQFSSWTDEDIRAAVLDDSRLSAEKLSLLLQVLKMKVSRSQNSEIMTGEISGSGAPTAAGLLLKSSACCHRYKGCHLGDHACQIPYMHVYCHSS